MSAASRAVSVFDFLIKIARMYPVVGICQRMLVDSHRKTEGYCRSGLIRGQGRSYIHLFQRSFRYGFAYYRHRIDN